MAPAQPGRTWAAILSALLIGAACSSGGNLADDEAPPRASTQASATASETSAEPTSTTLHLEPVALDPLPAGCADASADSSELRVALRHSSSQLITPTPVHVLEGIQQYLRHSGARELIDEILVLDSNVPLTVTDLEGITLLVDYDQILRDGPTAVLDAIDQSCTLFLPVIPQPPYLNTGSALVLPTLVPGRPALADLIAAEAAPYPSIGLITGTGHGITDLLAETLPDAVVIEATGSPVGAAADQPPLPDDIAALLANDPDLIIIDSLCKANGESLVDAGYVGQIWYLLPDCLELQIFAAETPATNASWLVGPSIVDVSFDSPFKQAAVAVLNENELDQRTGLIGWNIGWYIEQLLEPIGGDVTRQTVLTNAHSIDTIHPHLAVKLETGTDSDHVIDELFWHKLESNTWQYEHVGPTAP